MSKQPKGKYAVIKKILVILNALAVISFMASVTMLYSNTNFKAGITNLNTQAYEDSPSFVAQFGQDIQYAFDYIDNKETFETDGSFDPDKIILSISDGPIEDMEYSLKDIVAAARRRGYYLDEKYQILSMPDIVTSNDDTTYTVNWTTYDETREINEPSDEFVTIDELIQEVLTRLSKYYAAYDRLIENPCNFSFLIKYDNDVFTNNKALSSKNIDQLGRFAVCDGSELRIRTNLVNVPTNIGYLLENSRYNNEDIIEKQAYVAVDTNYPEQDVYLEEARAYAIEREQYFRELLAASISVIIIAVTLILLFVFAFKYRDEYEQQSIFRSYKKSVEGRIFACALAIIVLLYLNEKVFKRILHIYLPFDSWEFAERVVGYGCIYGCCMATFFSILHSAIAGNLWKYSLTRKLFEKLDKYIEEHDFSTRATLSFISILLLEVVMVTAMILLFIKQKTLVGRFAAIGMVLLFLIVNMILFLLYYKKTQQQDKIASSISNIAKGNTSYQLNEDEFDGKEKDVAHSINNIGEDLENAVEERVKSERMKSDLITNVSHDIRTPLTSIINYIDLIKRENPEDQKIREYLDVLDKKSQHLKNLTEDLLEASKASSGNVNLDMMEMDFVKMVQQANGEFEEKYAERGLSLVANYPVDRETGAKLKLNIMADGASLWRVLENLYNNAYKYAAENSRVYIDMRKTDDGKAEFVIKNISSTPLNISADELSERFVRGDVSRTTEGSGLGLSIAGSLTRIQGGDFHIEIDGDLFKAFVVFDMVG
ncbi:MAG: histidine kinase dimerization/phospho-acceptor domain-containing protein [Lachnospiraceae bacterium]|nr:histidine kinase dimerization/phospho-acceptor domain-containing protein [Lachnospiraceae bacterium]